MAEIGYVKVRWVGGRCRVAGLGVPAYGDELELTPQQAADLKDMVEEIKPPASPKLKRKPAEKQPKPEQPKEPQPQGGEMTDGIQ